MKKVPYRFHRFVMTAIMVCMMSFLMSGIILWMNLGWSDHFLSNWFHAFMKVFPIAFIASLVATPIAKKIADLITEVP